MSQEEILKIQYNTKIIEKFRELGIPADLIGSVFFALFALDEGKIELLNAMDNHSKDRRFFILCRTLQRKKLLDTSPPDSEIYFSLNDTSRELIAFIREQFVEEVKAETFEPVLSVNSEDIILNWIQEYIDLFPMGLRDHPVIAAERMEEFMSKFTDYDKEIILCATKEYIREQEQKEEGHRYTMRSINFIYKPETKTYTLSSWCLKCEIKDKNEMDTRFMDIA
jgi:hypothetical protein